MTGESSSEDLSMTDYGAIHAGAVGNTASSDQEDEVALAQTRSCGEESNNKDRVAFHSTKLYHHDHRHHHDIARTDSDSQGSGSTSALLSTASSQKKADSPIRRLAIDLSLWVNVIILLTKVTAYAMTLSLSVLAALTDSVLDVVSQLVLNYTEKHSALSRSSALYPAGASRLEPLGVLICAALMGFASFEIIKESFESLIFDKDTIATEDNSMLSFFSMLAVVLVKLALWLLCNRAARTRVVNRAGKQTVKVADPTVEAIAQDHFNDMLSNLVAAIALLFALNSERFWFIDPLGAIAISLYIIYSWYETAKEQMEHLTGKSAPPEFIEEILEIANNFDSKMTVDICRAYHFGPKFLVELEVVLPKNTLLGESHDLGMDLQFEIEAMEEVERCFVHIDYEMRPYDEHIVSKVPELRERILRQQSSSCIHSV